MRTQQGGGTVTSICLPMSLINRSFSSANSNTTFTNNGASAVLCSLDWPVIVLFFYFTCILYSPSMDRWIVYIKGSLEFFEFLNHIDDSGISDIRAVFFECHNKQYRCSINLLSFFDDQFNKLSWFAT